MELTKLGHLQRELVLECALATDRQSLSVSLMPVTVVKLAPCYHVQLGVIGAYG